MLEIRVVVPSRLQHTVLQELHDSHPGIQRMKSVAHSHVWWPRMDKDIEQLARHVCLASIQASTHGGTIASLDLAIMPMKRIHVNIAGPFQGTAFLVEVDAHSM